MRYNRFGDDFTGPPPRWLFLVTLGLLAIAVVGCAPMTPAPMVAALAPVSAIAAPVECESSACWQRAQAWIVRHSRWKIRAATDVQIDTFNPIGDDVERATYAFTALREPIGRGRYRISLAVSCGSTSPLIACNPKSVDVQRAFYHFVTTGTDVLEGLTHLDGIRSP